ARTPLPPPRLPPLPPFFFLTLPRPPTPTIFPYSTLFRSLEDQLLDIARGRGVPVARRLVAEDDVRIADEGPRDRHPLALAARKRSEEHTSELQSQSNLVCRLLLEKKNNKS